MIYKKCREVWLISRKQMREEISNIRIWLGYLAGICMAVLRTLSYLGYAQGKSIQMFEPFILIMNDYTYCVFIFLAFFIVTADSPFINGRSVYTVLRASRLSWYLGMTFYLFIQTVLYLMAIWGATVLVAWKTVYVQNTWSTPVYSLAMFQPTDALVNWGLLFAGADVIRYLSPVRSFFYTFLLNTMYLLALQLLPLWINLNGRWIVGNIAAILFHLAGILAISSGTIIKKYSLLIRSQLILHVVTESGVKGLALSVGIFGGVIAFEMAGGLLTAGRTDFVTARGDKE